MVRTYITYLFLLFCDYKYISVQKDWKQIVLGETQRVRTDDKYYRGNYSVLLTVQKWEIISLCSQKITYIYIYEQWSLDLIGLRITKGSVSQRQKKETEREKINASSLRLALFIYLLHSVHRMPDELYHWVWMASSPGGWHELGLSLSRQLDMVIYSQ